MAHGHHDGRDVHHPDVRRLFERETVLASDWYRKRLEAKRQVDVRLWSRHAAALDDWLAANGSAPAHVAAEMRRRRAHAADRSAEARGAGYVDGLHGTLGTDPSVVPRG
jgi:hypothetical protein